MSAIPSTVSTAGPVWPTEWAPQQAVWLSWPLNEATWPGKLPQMQRQWAGIAAALAPFVVVRINCVAPAQPVARRLLAEAGVPEERYELWDVPTDDVWVRDHGALFVFEAGRPGLARFRYNAWGGKFPHDRDSAVPDHWSEQLGLPLLAQSPLIAEGGGLEVNGAGLLLTTESVLLNANRNPDWGQSDVEAELKRCLGVTEVAWLKQGLEGDDTDGHIDTLTRFCNPTTIVTVVERDSRDANYRPLQENLERLQGLRTPTGGRFDIAELPLPEAIFVEGWRYPRLPGTHANFLITNGAVLVPTYRQPKRDGYALGLLRELFPRHQVIGHDCLDIVLEGGALHCLTQQQAIG